MSPILQGSALWRALIQPTRKSGCAEPRRFVRRSRCRFVRKGLAPDMSREACCLDFGGAACPGFTKIRFNGGRHTRTLSRSTRRFVRKGLEGREAVAANIKKHAVHVFYICRDGTPAKPGFLRSRLPGISCPRRGTVRWVFSRGLDRLHGRRLFKAVKSGI
jgi:hypothetical protein